MQGSPKPTVHSGVVVIIARKRFMFLTLIALLLLSFSLPVYSAGYSISGTVKDCKGKAMAGVKVEIDIDLDDTVTNTLDAAGAFMHTGPCAFATMDYCVRIIFPDGRKPEEFCGSSVNCMTPVVITFDCKKAPKVCQGDNQECGPSCGSSIVGWLRQNGYPDLVDGKTLSAIQTLLAGLANTDAVNGTDDVSLVTALNCIINDSKYKGCIVARRPKGVTYPVKAKETIADKKDKPPFIILLQSKPNYSHYVVVDKVTVDGMGNPTASTMDPFSGERADIPLTLQGGKLKGTFTSGSFSGTVCIASIICLDPVAKAAGSDASAGGDKEISYTPTYDFDLEASPRDFHIQVYDSDPALYNVTGLPPGWAWQFTSNATGFSVISAFDNDSGTVLASNQVVTLTYSGALELGLVRRAMQFGYSGDPFIQVFEDAPQEILTIAPPPEFAEPEAPENLLIGFNHPDPFAPPFIELSWPAVAVPPGSLGPVEYVVIDAAHGTVLTNTTASGVVLEPPWINPDFEPSLAVYAQTPEGLSGPASPGAEIYLSDEAVAEATALEPIASFLTPVNDCPTGNGDCGSQQQITFFFAGLMGNVNVHLTTAIGSVAPPLLPGQGKPQPMFYHVAAPGLPPTVMTFVELPWDPSWVSDRGTPPQLYQEVGGNWFNITQSVDLTQKRIQGLLLPEMGTLIITGPTQSGDWFEVK